MAHHAALSSSPSQLPLPQTADDLLSQLSSSNTSLGGGEQIRSPVLAPVLDERSPSDSLLVSSVTTIEEYIEESVSPSRHSRRPSCTLPNSSCTTTPKNAFGKLLVSDPSPRTSRRSTVVSILSIPSVDVVSPLGTSRSAANSRGAGAPWEGDRAGILSSSTGNTTAWVHRPPTQCMDSKILLLTFLASLVATTIVLVALTAKSYDERSISDVLSLVALSLSVFLLIVGAFLRRRNPPASFWRPVYDDSKVANGFAVDFALVILAMVVLFLLAPATVHLGVTRGFVEVCLFYCMLPFIFVTWRWSERVLAQVVTDGHATAPSVSGTTLSPTLDPQQSEAERAPEERFVVVDIVIAENTQLVSEATRLVSKTMPRLATISTVVALLLAITIHGLHLFSQCPHHYDSTGHGDSDPVDLALHPHLGADYNEGRYICVSRAGTSFCVCVGILVLASYHLMTESTTVDVVIPVLEPRRPQTRESQLSDIEQSFAASGDVDEDEMVASSDSRNDSLKAYPPSRDSVDGEPGHSGTGSQGSGGGVRPFGAPPKPSITVSSCLLSPEDSTVTVEGRPNSAAVAEAAVFESSSFAVQVRGASAVTKNPKGAADAAMPPIPVGDDDHLFHRDGGLSTQTKPTATESHRRSCCSDRSTPEVAARVVVVAVTVKPKYTIGVSSPISTVDVIDTSPKSPTAFFSGSAEFRASRKTADLPMDSKTFSDLLDLVCRQARRHRGSVLQHQGNEVLVLWSDESSNTAVCTTPHQCSPPTVLSEGQDVGASHHTPHTAVECALQFCSALSFSVGDDLQSLLAVAVADGSPRHFAKKKHQRHDADRSRDIIGGGASPLFIAVNRAARLAKLARSQTKQGSVLVDGRLAVDATSFALLRPIDLVRYGWGVSNATPGFFTPAPPPPFAGGEKKSTNTTAGSTQRLCAQDLDTFAEECGREVVAVFEVAELFPSRYTAVTVGGDLGGTVHRSSSISSPSSPSCCSSSSGRSATATPNDSALQQSFSTGDIAHDLEALVTGVVSPPPAKNPFLISPPPSPRQTVKPTVMMRGVQPKESSVPEALNRLLSLPLHRRLERVEAFLLDEKIKVAAGRSDMSFF